MEIDKNAYLNIYEIKKIDNIILMVNKLIL
jgi:hypothetical protein